MLTCLRLHPTSLGNYVDHYSDRVRRINWFGISAFFCERGFTTVGTDNNMRQVFFGENTSTQWNRDRLLQDYGDKYIHHTVDIRDHEAIAQVFQTYGKDIDLIIHTAAQPSHDWAAREPYTDFTVKGNL